MKKIMGLILSGVLLSTTSAFAGLTLSSSNPEYNTQTVKLDFGQSLSSPDKLGALNT